MSALGGEERAPLAASVLAVARLSAAAALRAPGVRAVALGAALATVAIAVSATGDGSATGRLRAFLSWTAELAGLLVALCAVFLGTGLATRLRRGELTQLVAGPLPGPALLLGWWAGAAATLALLVALTHAALAAGAVRLRAHAEPADAAAMSRVLQARARVRPVPLDPALFEARAAEQLAALHAAERVPEGVSDEEALARLTAALALRARSAPSQRTIAWRYEGVAPSGPELLVRFRHRAERAEAELVPRPVRGELWIVPRGAQDALTLAGSWPAGDLVEVAAPSSALAGQQQVEVRYTNLEPSPTVVVFEGAGPELLYPAGSFLGNVARCAAVSLGRAAFLAAAAVAAAALLDAPLAALVGLFVLVVGAAQGFLADALVPGTFGALDRPLQGALRGVLLLVPDLGRVDLPGLLAGGEQVPLAEVRDALALDLGLRGGGALLAAGALLGRRELGALR